MNEWTPTLGAIPTGEGVTFRVWAPKPQHIGLVLLDERGAEIGEIGLEKDGEDRLVTVQGIAAGQRYAYRVDGAGPFPDPCSRRQPEGVHGPSEVVDPRAFSWEDESFQPVAARDLCIYEMHIGTFTPQGTFASAAGGLRRLADLGVNAVEVMPIASFPGRWNWGYDGAALFAPAEVYGGPEGFRRFVNVAHQEGLAVLLDVVFNHFGPDGNYTGLYSDHYLTRQHQTPWGDAVNFDDEGCEGVRRMVVENLLHWRHEYHLDGFRFDATHAIVDDSPRHILAEVSEALESQAGGRGRPILIAESHENDPRYVHSRKSGGFGFDAVWADDFHHAARRLMRAEEEGYLAAFEGTREELAKTIEQGFLFEGQPMPGGEPRGKPARDVPWSSFVYCLQNHDQVGNRAFGDRLATTIGRDRQLALTVLLLALPQVPLIFQGQEWASTQPFQYFTDHTDELGRLVTEGRRREFREFRAFRDEGTRARIPDPQDEATFRRSQLNADEGRGLGALAADLHRELLRLRGTDSVLVASREGRAPLRARATGSLVVVELENEAGRRMAVVNASGEQTSVEVGDGATILVSSTDARWGGPGDPGSVEGGRVVVPGHCGMLVRLGS